MLQRSKQGQTPTQFGETSPELIFVFRGPILRCSKGNLPAEVKQVVWHEVAHWLGHDEGEVKELGLSLPSEIYRVIRSKAKRQRQSHNRDSRTRPRRMTKQTKNCAA